jgi:hypothetical protein
MPFSRDNVSHVEKMLTGASVLLFEKDCLLLFRERNTRYTCQDCKRKHSNCCYTEPGGKYEDKHLSIDQAAEDELYEETCCLFDCKYVCKLKKDNFFDLVYEKNKMSRVFMLDVPYMKNLIRDYDSNLETLINYKADKHYLETNDVTRVSIDRLREAVFGGDDMKSIFVEDIYGKEIQLKKRTANILYVLFNEIDRGTKLKIKHIHSVKERISPDSGLIHYLI